MAERTGNEVLLNQFSKMTRPIPGQSLTADPSNPSPFESAPEFTKKNDAIEEIFIKLTDEEIYPQVMGAIADKVPIIEMTQLLLTEGFRQGKWNPDLFLMLIEPTAYIIMALSDRAGIEYEIDRDVSTDENEGSEIDKEFNSIQSTLKSGSGSEFIPDEIEKRIEELPQDSLLSRSEAEEKIEIDEENIQIDENSLLAKQV